MTYRKPPKLIGTKQSNHWAMEEYKSFQILTSVEFEILLRQISLFFPRKSTASAPVPQLETEASEGSCGLGNTQDIPKIFHRTHGKTHEFLVMEIWWWKPTLKFLKNDVSPRKHGMDGMDLLSHPSNPKAFSAPGICLVVHPILAMDIGRLTIGKP